jgi:hypothetical protein
MGPRLRRPSRPPRARHSSSDDRDTWHSVTNWSATGCTRVRRARRTWSFGPPARLCRYRAGDERSNSAATARLSKEAQAPQTGHNLWPVNGRSTGTHFAFPTPTIVRTKPSKPQLRRGSSCYREPESCTDALPRPPRSAWLPGSPRAAHSRSGVPLVLLACSRGWRRMVGMHSTKSASGRTSGLD